MKEGLRATGRCSTQKDRTEMEDRYNTSETRSDAGRFGRWLSTRPAESWMFFGAGVLLGGLFF
tara:strand:+ start:3762 stop:3950 length:189 start_codon:yes stop_codon:yes gene_type:complete